MTLVTSILLIITIIAFAIFAFYRLKWATLFVIVALPVYLIRFSVLGIPLTLLEAMILILFAVLLIRKKGKIELTSWWWLIMLLVIASIISLFITPDLRAGLGLFKAYIIEPILLYIVITNLFEKNDLPKIWTALGISGIIIAIITLVQYITGSGIPDPWFANPGRRAVAVYGFPNAVGLYLAPIASLFIGKFILGKKQRWFSALVVILSALAILASRTEGALAALLISFVCVGIFTRKRFLVLGGFLTVLIIAFIIPQTRDILLFQDVSGQVRLALWEGTKNLLMARPLEGAGLAGFPIVYDQYRLARHVELLEYPHNIFLNFWVELGLLGLIWIVFTLITFFTKAWKYRSIETKILIGVMVGIIVYGLVDVPYFKNDLSVLFWIFIAMLTLISSASEIKHKKRI